MSTALVPAAQTQTALAPHHTSALAITSIDELERMGKIIAASNLFGLASKGDAPETVAAKGVVVAGLCQQEGISFMEFMRKYHFVNGKVDMRTDAMLAEFQRLGGTYTIQQSDAAGSIATFSFRGTTFQERVIWDELCKEPEPPFFEQIGANKWQVKSNYAYPRKRSQMLWARCVSNGIRKVCPMVNMGVYTPEETSEFVEVAPAEVPAAPVEAAHVEVAPAAAPKATPKRRAARKPAPAPVEEAEVVEAEVVEADELVAEPAPAPAPAPQPGTAPAIPFPATPDDDPEQFAICPCEGKAKGMRWDKIASENLRQIVEAYENPDYDRSYFAGMTDDHAAYIRAVLATREQEEK
jgi:hypothetical protein